MGGFSCSKTWTGLDAWVRWDECILMYEHIDGVRAVSALLAKAMVAITGMISQNAFFGTTGPDMWLPGASAFEGVGGVSGKPRRTGALETELRHPHPPKHVQNMQNPSSLEIGMLSQHVVPKFRCSKAGRAIQRELATLGRVNRLHHVFSR